MEGASADLLMHAAERWYARSHMGGCEEFQGSDAKYLARLGAHPHGYELNVDRPPSRNVHCLHVPAGYRISTPTRRPGGFTQRDFIKVCADSLDALLACVRARWPEHGEVKRCGCVNKRAPRRR